MGISLSALIILMVCGFFISLMGGMFGLGGGVFIVPLLYFGFDVPLESAVACSLVTIVASSMTSTMAKVRSGLVNIRLSKIMEVPSILGAIFGSLVIHVLPINTIKILFIIVASVSAFNMLKNPFRKFAGKKEKQHYIPPDVSCEFADRYRDKATGKTVIYEARHPVIASVSCVGAGLLSSLIGVGGGVVNVPIITMVCRAPVKVASATSSYKLGITAAAGSLIYFSQGFVLPQYALPLVLSTFAGAYVGMNLLVRTKPFIVELSFGVFMIFVIIKMALSL